MIVLIFRCQQNRVAILTESSPAILKYVIFEQNALCIFQFKEILHDKGPSGSATHESRLARFPDHRFEQMIATNLDVSRCHRGTAPAKQNALTRGFQEVVDGLERPTGSVSSSVADDLGISA